MSHFKNIIVRMPNWIGDLIMATPVLADLKIHYPSSSITAMALDKPSSLLKNNPYVNTILSIDAHPDLKRKKEHKRLIELLIKRQYDLGIILTNSFSSAWLFWRGKVSERIGYQADFRSLLLTHCMIKPDIPMHQVDLYKHLLSIVHIPQSTTLPEIFLTQEEIQTATTTLQALHIENKEIIGIHPGAAFGPAKCWLPERYREVAQILLEDPNKAVLFFGDRNSKEWISHITKDLHQNAFDLSGQTSLRELAALISRCSLLLTNDSGPMHIAAALQIPLLALFGSTNDTTTGPYHHPHSITLHKHVGCSPCYLRTCPLDFQCMKAISTDEVLQKIHAALNHQKTALR